MRLLLLHPEVARRDCSHCLEYQYEEKGANAGRVIQWRGAPLRRPKGVKAPCAYGRCPKGSPDAGLALSEKNELAYEHYQKCKAVGRFPRDAIVERNAALFSRIETSVERSESRDFQQLLMAIIRAGHA